ncbi:hypothetical protein H0O02_00920 [Candidatus Micrarchaeota archaeon]|nr:hypothetical protein [Candidatus Micrarchaeota archaeon]
MQCEAEIRLEFPDEHSARAAEKALSHEGAVGPRSSCELKRSGKSMRVSIAAKDAVAMRATLNAFMREFQVFESLEMGRLQYNKKEV